MPTLRLKNSYTKAVETFAPLAPGGEVLLYSCGPTVYSFAHIGNFRSFLMADVLRRTLERAGYRVRHVMNITDVGHMTVDHLADAEGEDKLAKAARELGWDPYKVARHYEQAFVDDAKLLRMKNYAGAEGDDPARHPRATAHVPEMLALIDLLLERGFAYADGRGQIYFEVAKFPQYGQLSGKVLDELEAGARVAVREEKKDPRDFALWKVDDKHLMQWDPHSPEGWPEADWRRFRELAPEGVDARIGRGFPGWHIECSAMAKAGLGARIDLHTGGEDNVFPHHECEIAQSWAASDEAARGDAFAPFARYWVHARHLLVDNKKMSKRDGTFFTVRDLVDPRASGRPEVAERLEGLGFAGGRVPAHVLRYALVSNPYHQPMNFSFDLLEQAKASVERLQSRFDRLREVAGPGEPSPRVRELVGGAVARFDEALFDNLNVPNALAAAFDLVSGLNVLDPLAPGDAAHALAAFDGFDAVLDVLDRRVRAGLLASADLAARAAGALPSYDDLVARPATDAEVVEGLVVLRQAARKARDFARADAIRDELRRRGVLLDDTPQGVRWRLPLSHCELAVGRGGEALFPSPSGEG
ncbi:MAG TPA: cysteine--tRNA ligase [Polyangiaceae bacterium]|nr:cysteine--tRNA ligase [Polyangiaceae bacterium]